MMLGLAFTPLQAGVYTGYDLDGNGLEDYADDDGNIWNSYEDWQSANSFFEDQPEETNPDPEDDPGSMPEDSNSEPDFGGLPPENGGGCQPPENTGGEVEDTTYVPPPQPPLPPEDPIITLPPPEEPPLLPVPKKRWNYKLKYGGSNSWEQTVGELGYLYGNRLQVEANLYANDAAFSVSVESFASSNISFLNRFGYAAAMSLTGSIIMDSEGNLDVNFAQGQESDVRDGLAAALAVASVEGAGSQHLSVNIKAGGANLNDASISASVSGVGLDISLGGGETAYYGGFNTLIWESFEETYYDD